MFERPLVLSALTAIVVLTSCGSVDDTIDAPTGESSGGNPTTPTGGGTAVVGSSRGGATNTNGGTSNGGTSNAGGSPVTTGGTPISKGGSSATSGVTSAVGGTTAKSGSSVTGGVTSAVGGTTTMGTPRVRIVGRTTPGTDGAVRFEWPGVNMHARFTGTQVSMDLGASNKTNRFTVVVDGGPPRTVTAITGKSSLQLASGLTSGTHELVIWRNTEASPGGMTEFIGLSNFGTGGALLEPATAPERRIEVIGDSLSAGAGVEGTSNSCTPNIDAFTNNYLAYGSVAARAVKADVVTIAWSGIGVYRGYTASEPTMPTRYPYALPSTSTAWDFSEYQPHVVVINLGTNDFGAGNPGAGYVTAYVDFVKTVRSKYTSANVILIDMYGGERATAINSVVNTLGDSKIEMLSFSDVQNNLACNQHPNTSAQQAMGNKLATRLKAVMSW